MAERRIADILKLLAAANEAKDKAQGVLNAAAQKVSEIEDELLLKMDAEGTTIVNGAGLKVTIQKKNLVQVKDWDALYQFMMRKKAPELLQRRISQAVYDELAKSVRGGVLPGCGVFEKTTLSVRSDN